LWDPISKTPNTKKGCGVAQGVDTEFKLQYSFPPYVQLLFYIVLLSHMWVDAQPTSLLKLFIYSYTFRCCPIHLEFPCLFFDPKEMTLILFPNKCLHNEDFWFCCFLFCKFCRVGNRTQVQLHKPVNSTTDRFSALMFSLEYFKN
jgi:hypothetical protein